MAQQTEPSLYSVSIEWSENGKLYGPTNRTIPILRFRRMVYRMVFLFCAHIGKLYDPKKFLSFNPKMENYMIPQIKVRLNLHINSTLMSHQMVFTFCAHILNSHIAWHSRKITVA